MVSNEDKVVKTIILFLGTLVGVCFVALIALFFLDAFWGFKALVLGVILIFLSVYITFFKVILMQKYNLINPGGKELQGIILILMVSGIIIIFIALLNLMSVIPWY